MLKGFDDKIWHRPTLPRVTAVPLALAGLTSLFGMGRGRHRRYRHLNIFNVDDWRTYRLIDKGLISFFRSIDLYSKDNNDILLKEVTYY
jgi:hypothetical protein